MDCDNTACKFIWFNSLSELKALWKFKVEVWYAQACWGWLLFISWQHLHYINSCYRMPDLKTGIGVHSCQQQLLTRQQNISSTQKTISNVLQSSLEQFYGGVILWCRKERKVQVRPNSIAIEFQLKMENLTNERSVVLFTGCQDS